MAQQGVELQAFQPTHCGWLFVQIIELCDFTQSTTAMQISVISMWSQQPSIGSQPEPDESNPYEYYLSV
jgi:hypothetical protein